MSQNVTAAAQAAQAVEATGGIGTLGINLKIFIAQLINFAVVLLVLWKWAYTPIVKLLEERQAKIEKGVKEAADAHRRIKEIEEEHAKMVSQAKTEAAAMMDEARASAEDRKQALLEKAKEEVKGVVAQGKAQLQAQKEAMMREAREEMAALAVAAARKILEDGVDEKKAMKLAAEVVEKV